MKKYFILRIIAFLILIFSGFVFVTEDFTITHIEFVLESIITVATTLTGFLFTGITLLVGFSSKVLQDISSDKPVSYELKLRCCESILLGLVVIVICIVCGACVDETNQISIWWIRAFIFVCGWFLISFAEISYYLVRIILISSTVPPVQVSKEKGIPKSFLTKK